MPQNRNVRRWLRLPLAVEVRVRDADDPVGGEIMFDAVDISAGGAFLRSDYLLEKGDRLDVSFTLPEAKQRITARAQVVWVAKTRRTKGEAGMGIEFVDLSEAERAAITEFVKAHRTSSQLTAQTP
jgi:uncharacterized protein (TIGR02266 family)